MPAVEANNMAFQNIRFFGQLQSQKKDIIFIP